MRLAILDDDVASCKRLAQLMVEAGHDVTQFRDIKSMLRSLRQNSFDLLLLDWTLPGSSGRQALSWIRQHLDPAPPTIMITARSGDTDIIEGLTCGADDYIVKPLADEVLKARIAALLRRVYAGRPKRGVEQYGQYAFDVQHRRVTVAGTLVATTAKEFALSLLMFRNLHRPLSRGHILEMVWGQDPDLISRTLDAHVSQIRRRLKLRPENGLRLSSVYGFGYRLERTEAAFEPAVANDRGAVQGSATM